MKKLWHSAAPLLGGTGSLGIKSSHVQGLSDTFLDEGARISRTA
jgi:hypothetical protein